MAPLQGLQPGTPKGQRNDVNNEARCATCAQLPARVRVPSRPPLAWALQRSPGPRPAQTSLNQLRREPRAAPRAPSGAQAAPGRRVQSLGLQGRGGGSPAPQDPRSCHWAPSYAPVHPRPGWLLRWRRKLSCVFAKSPQLRPQIPKVLDQPQLPNSDATPGKVLEHCCPPAP
jgi:hypothetical protein